MQGHYDAWLQSSHRAAASCNGCHTPGAVLPKYVTKASNGFWHSFAFTTGWFHEPIRIKAGNLGVTEQRCRDCHAAVVAMIASGHEPDARRACTTCHADVGHRR